MDQRTPVSSNTNQNMFSNFVHNSTSYLTGGSLDNTKPTPSHVPYLSLNSSSGQNINFTRLKDENTNVTSSSILQNPLHSTFEVDLSVSSPFLPISEEISLSSLNRSKQNSLSSLASSTTCDSRSDFLLDNVWIPPAEQLNSLLREFDGEDAYPNHPNKSSTAYTSISHDKGFGKDFKIQNFKSDLVTSDNNVTNSISLPAPSTDLAGSFNVLCNQDKARHKNVSNDGALHQPIEYAVPMLSHLKKQNVQHISINELPTRSPLIPVDNSLKSLSSLTVSETQLANFGPVIKLRREQTCSFCGRSFKSKSALSRHISIHPREKPFKCEVCNYKAADMSSLKIHKKSHNM